ncbi:deoxycytidylate deaminase [Aeromonas phage avDM12-TAAL]|nr:deoxycytidylate deaminase [Aeromonas phage avDM12-TAAL]
MKTTTFLQNAFLVAQESKCVSYRVGAIISKDDRPISSGYNGTISGQPNCDEVAEENGWAEYVDVPGVGKELRLRQDKSDEYSAWAKSNVIHAEMNAILFAAHGGKSIEGATMYCTMAPCPECAKTIAQAKIKTLVYCEDYNGSNADWAETLTRSGIKVIKIDKKYLTMLNWEKVLSKRKRIE